MKANEFVKRHGLNEVKKILQCAPDFALSILDDGDETDLCDLRCLVESHEIVELFGGVEQCKKDLNRLIANNVFEFEHRFVDNIKCTTERFKQAIADVEACQ